MRQGWEGAAGADGAPLRDTPVIALSRIDQSGPELEYAAGEREDWTIRLQLDF